MNESDFKKTCLKFYPKLNFSQFLNKPIKINKFYCEKLQKIHILCFPNLLILLNSLNFHK